MNMQALMRQAQNLQKDMAKAKEELDLMEFEASSSFVSIKANGKKEILEVKINKTENLEMDDFELLEDMILIACNECFKKIDEASEEKMGQFSNMMPGLF